jgi:peptidyl-tRNA hydrolase
MKQFIIIRKDLIDIAPIGKMMSQACHASVGACRLVSTSDLTDWQSTGETKITLSVKNEFQILKIIDKLNEANIPHSKIIDEGRTVFDGPTLTCVGVGPMDHNTLNEITKKLQLLK